jgi:hypothetical protein
MGAQTPYLTARDDGIEGEQLVRAGPVRAGATLLIRKDASQFSIMEYAGVEHGAKRLLNKGD